MGSLLLVKAAGDRRAGRERKRRTPNHIFQATLLAVTASQEPLDLSEISEA